MNEQIETISKWLGTGSINIFGRPFAGKDTQGEKLADIFRAPLIGGGEILRSQHDNARLQQILSTGDLIPSDLYEEIVVPYLANPEFANKPLLLSSVGRSSGEETIIVRAAETADHPLRAVVLLDMPEDVIWRRFNAAQALDDRGDRSDDSRDVLQNRIEEFNQKTMPVIEFYRDRGLLITVDGTKSREEVTEEILDALTQKASEQATD